MKKAIIAASLITLVLIFYSAASASTVYEDVGIIQGAVSNLSSFEANVAPFKYVVTLTDLSPQPELGFNFLGLTLLDTNGIIDSLFGAGEFAFDPVPNQKYYVNVFGEGSGEYGAAVYGVQVAAVPIPAAVWLLGGGLIGLVGLRRKLKN
jgi:hypothetical protein